MPTPRAPVGPQAAVPGPCMEEQVEAMPDRRLHFSRAASLVSVFTLSYAFWIFYLCRRPDTEAARAFYEEVNDPVYMWPMVAFATAILLNLLSMAFERRPVKRQLCFLAAYISGVAFVYEFLAWKRAAPIYITAAGRPISLLRYVMWGHATPLMIYALSMISDFSAAQVWQTMAVDIVMIATVIPGELIPAWHRWIWNGISCAVYPYIFHQLWHMYSAGIQEAREDGAQTSLRMLRNVTVIFWTAFPVVWVLVQLEWVDVFTEEVLWCVADTLGKIFFSSTLLHSNFMSIEHRRMMAMRVVEEANRIRVIHELRQLVEQKEQFIALMSHELRTPLNGIIGLSNVLLMDSDTMQPETTKTLTTIRNSGARLLNLINDILDAAALRKGKLAVAHGKVNLKNVADDVIDLSQALVKQGVSIRNKIGADTPQVVGDTSRLVQVLYNLLGNACKFTERGDIWVEANLSDDGETVSVSVHDTGIGIPEDKLEEIFDPFAQVDMSTTRRYGGTGLGLNLVKQLVDAHGGAITVASRRGKGSVFTFTLRVWHDEDGAAPAPLTEATRKSLSQAARAAAREAGEALDRVPMPAAEREPLLGSSSMSRSMSRRDSEPDMMQRLSHDAQPANMLQRLSADSRLRSSYDADYTNYHKAPQQLAPQAAFNAFLSAGPHEVVKQIQQGKVGQPSEVAAAAHAVAAGGGGGRGGGQPRPAAPQPLHDWLLAEQAVKEASTSGEIKVGSGGAGGVHREWLARSGKQLEHAAWAAGQRALVPACWRSRISPGSVASGLAGSAMWSNSVQVLSVDDDPVNQMVIQTMLTKAGFRVLKAPDGQKALDMLEVGAAWFSCPAADLSILLMAQCWASPGPAAGLCLPARRLAGGSRDLPCAVTGHTCTAGAAADSSPPALRPRWLPPVCALQDCLTHNSPLCPLHPCLPRRTA
ncbi:hypothetical protein ABPG75_004635 [Micractinium tetrahymenae]